MHRTAHRVSRVVATGIVAIIALITVAPTAFAQTATTPTTASGATGQPLPLAKGLLVSGATVKTPGQPVRNMTASQALAFMQAWYPYSVFGHARNENPPATLPVSVMRLTTIWNGNTFVLTIFFAIRGTTSWVGMPKQDFGWSFVQKLNWIRAPKGTIDAFEGKVLPVLAPTTTTPPTTAATTTDPSPSGGSSSSRTGLWIGLAAALVVIAGGGFALLRTRKRTAS